jgi:hypothetical protein
MVPPSKMEVMMEIFIRKGWRQKRGIISKANKKMREKSDGQTLTDGVLRFSKNEEQKHNKATAAAPSKIQIAPIASRTYSLSLPERYS